MVFPARAYSFDTVDTETVASKAEAQTPPPSRHPRLQVLQARL